jgi:GlpG protein
MRLIGTLVSNAHASTFADFLYSEGIKTQIEETSDGRYEIWVLHDDNVEKATSLFEQFQQSPDDPAYRQQAKAGSRQKKHDKKEKTPTRNRIIDARTAFYRKPIPLGRLSIVLIAVSLAVTLFTNLGRNERLARKLQMTEPVRQNGYIAYDMTLPEIRHGQVWRLWTPIFLHFGILHIIFNMLWLRDLGSMVEARKGIWTLLTLVLIIGALSNLGQFYMSGPRFGGMSGVVFGLLGYVWMQGKFNPAAEMSLHKETVTLMIIWFFLGLTGLVGHIANTAHAVGAITGIAWGYIAARLAKRR